MTHPLPLRSLRHTPLPCHPAPDSGSSSGCSLQPRPPQLPVRGRLRWLRFDVLVQGPPGPDSAGLRSPSAGVMRANGALQVLGFLLSLARGSEVGNSQAGKRRVNTGRLGTWDSKLSAPNPGAAAEDRVVRAWGCSPRICWDHLGRDLLARVLGVGPRGTGFLDHPVHHHLRLVHRRPSNLPFALGLMPKEFTLLGGPCREGSWHFHSVNVR